MRKVILALAVCLGLAAYGGNGVRNENAAKMEQAKNVKDRVEILYFHGKQRCATCMAIEKNTKEAVMAQFAKEIKKELWYLGLSTSQSLRTRRLPRSMKLLGRHCSSASGKTVRRRMRTSLSMLLPMQGRIPTHSRVR